VVDCTCLENKSLGNGTASSNLAPSAKRKAAARNIGAAARL
jgi:hypothetical protein